MLRSEFRYIAPIEFPSFAGRQVYMHSFDLAKPHMVPGLEPYLEPVRRLCRAARAFLGTAHMTVDEKIIQPGMSQRRPGPHVDGCFMPSRMDWEHDDPSPGPGWNHNCNRIGGDVVGRMAVIVASSVPGCRAWYGNFDGSPKDDGDLSHITDQLGEGHVLPPNVGYLFSPDCVLESMRFNRPTQRSFLRIALPLGWYEAA